MLRFGGRSRRYARDLALLLAVVVLAIVVAVIDSGFYRGSNLVQMVQQNSALGLVVVGVGIVIIGGHWDLSVAGIAGLSGVLDALVARHHSIALALLAAILVGAACGLVNGIIVAFLRVDSFMGTFATGVFFLGFALKYQGAGEIDVSKKSFGTIGTGHVVGVPISIIVLAGVLAVSALVLRKTTIGLHLYAVGGNSSSARLMGVRGPAIACGSFVWSGMLAGLAGAMIASQLGLGTSVSASTLPIEAIAAVVIGGIAVSGGEGSMLQAAGGFILLTTVNNVAGALSWTTQQQQVAEGAVILLALAANWLSESSGRGMPRWIRRVQLAGAAGPAPIPEHETRFQ